MDTVVYVADFVVTTAVRFAPVFFLSVGLAAIIKSLPVARVASRWLAGREHASVVGGSVLGAFSPFCSCTVIPVVRSLLVAGAPLAGVMAFWVASPLMDPEIFLFTVGLLGWDLAVVRLVAAVALSLLAGVGAIVAVRRGWLPATLAEPDRDGRAPAGADADRSAPVGAAVGPGDRVAPSAVAGLPVIDPEYPVVGRGLAMTGSAVTIAAGDPATGRVSADAGDDAGCCDTAPVDVCSDTAPDDQGCGETPVDACCGASPTTDEVGLLGSLRTLDWSRVRADFLFESWAIGRWLLVAFVLEALILRYVPQEALIGVLGADAPWAVPLAALLGVPLYLDNLSALPVIAGLLEQGMAPGAAIAFLLAGPVTTIPAMTAVRAIMPGPVFRYYLAVAIGGSMLLGAAAGLVL